MSAISQLALKSSGTSSRPLAVSLGVAGATIALALVARPLVFAYVVGAAVLVILSVRHAITVVIIFTLLVPLMPKLPLIPIGGYLVPIRVEDVFLSYALCVVILKSVWEQRFRLPAPLTGSMLAFVAVQGVSLAFAMCFLDTISQPTIAMLYCLRSLEYFSASLLCLVAVRNWNQFRFVLIALAASVLLVGVYGVLQELSLVPAFDAMHQTGEIMQVYFFPSFQGDRLLSTFAGPYDLAAFYVIAIPILLSWLLVSRSKVARAAIGITIGVSVFCMYLTFARGPLLGLAIALLVCMSLLGRRRAAVVLAWSLPFAAFLVPEFRSRLNGLIDDPMGFQNWGGRLDWGWRSALVSFAHSPILGTGPSSLNNGLGVDSLYLLLLGSFGIVGLVAFIVLTSKTLELEYSAFAASRCTQLRAVCAGLAGATAGMLVIGITQEVFLSSKDALLFWFLVGLMLAGMFLERSSPNRASSSRPAQCLSAGATGGTKILPMGPSAFER